MTLASFLSDESLLPPAQRSWLERVAAHAAALGMPAYLVGGPVRDLMLRRPVRDIDVVVEGDAVQLGRALVKDFGGELTTHSHFRTATWSPADPDLATGALDLITARSETYARPGALPDVAPASIQEDLQRRDFTINAMALRLDVANPGQLLHPFGSREDLAHGLVRVLHPRSFLDDPTRMLRAVRYAVRYEFKIVPETLSLVNDEARAVLSGLSGERLRHEFDLIFEEKRPSAILVQLATMDLLGPIHRVLRTMDHGLPEVDEPPAEWGEFKTTDLLNLKQVLNWCLWLMDLPETEIDSVAERLVFPSALAKAARAASALLTQLPSLAGSKPSQWTFVLDDLPAAAIYAVYLRVQEPSLKEYLANWRHVFPKTTGEDLKARGLPPGPVYREILSRLRAARLDGEIRSGSEEHDLLENLLRYRHS